MEEQKFSADEVLKNAGADGLLPRLILLGGGCAM
jgi:hypothetical protein